MRTTRFFCYILFLKFFGISLKTEAKILVVDDEADIRDPLCEHLNRNGFTSIAARDAYQARHFLSVHSIDLIVLDIMMPGESGLSLCRFISETSATPVILLTALTNETDRINGLEIGADDYLSKPFNPRELVARIRSVLRRSRSDTKKYTRSNRDIQFGRWSLNIHSGELNRSDDIIITLSTGELRLLRVFLDNIGRTLSRDELFNLTKGREGFAFERSVDNMVSRLRRKIEKDPSNPSHIITIWGDGYQFVTDIA